MHIFHISSFLGGGDKKPKKSCQIFSNRMVEASVGVGGGSLMRD
jgi:hypothetical protein